MELPNQNKRTLAEKETWTYLGILEADTIKQVEMKQKIKEEYFKRTRKLLDTKHCSRNFTKGINTGLYPRKIFGIILEVDKRTKANRPKNKKTNDHA